MTASGLVDRQLGGAVRAASTAAPARSLIEWLQAQDPDWLANITHISMDFADLRPGRPAGLPDAVVVVDRFHLSALANKAVTDYRRELAWALRGRLYRQSERSGYDPPGSNSVASLAIQKRIYLCVNYVCYSA